MAHRNRSAPMKGEANVAPLLWFWTAAGIGLAVLAFRSYRLYRRAKTWPTARGLITHSRIVPGTRRTAVLVIRYEYYLPQTFAGCRASFSPSWCLSIGRMRQYLAHYAEGAETDVYYDPNDPKVSCLNPGDITGIRNLTVFAGICLCFLPGYYAVQYLVQ